MLSFDYIESFLGENRSNSSRLEAKQAHWYQAVDLSNNSNKLLPYFLIFPELLKEISNKQSHLFFDLLLNIFNIRDQSSWLFCYISTISWPFRGEDHLGQSFLLELLGDLDLVSLFSVDVFEVGDSCGSSNTVEVVL